MPDEPPPALVDRVTAMMGERPVEWRRTTGGYSTAERWVVTFEGGSSVFVKSGAGSLATFLRAEYEHVYSRIEAPFLPRLVGWTDDGAMPILLLEDLSTAYWPPAWLDGQVGAVLRVLVDLQAYAPALTGLFDVQAAHTDAALATNWSNVAKHPTEFLRLGLCSESWLRRALPALAGAAAETPLAGEDVLHLDVRSDNLCFRATQAVMVDWNHVCLGNRKLDIAFWLPSLHSEGGPKPEAITAMEPGWPAVVSGYFAARAGLPPITQAPMVRDVQLSQLRAALPWAVRALGLPPLDGPHAP
jgi:hypothetical protein